LLLIAVCLLILVAIVGSIWIGTEDAADIAGPPADVLQGRKRLAHTRRAAQLSIGAAVLVFVIQEALLIFANSNGPLSMPIIGANQRIALTGLTTALLVVMSLLLAISLSALSWRYAPRSITTVAAIAFALLLLAARVLYQQSWHGYLEAFAVAAVLVVLVPVAFSPTRMRDEPRCYEMWAGSAPGVLLLLATVIAMLMSSAVVVAIGNLLNGNLPPASLAGLPTPAEVGVGSGCEQQCDPHQDFPLTAPEPYLWFGVGLFCVIIVLTLLSPIPWVLWHRGPRQPMGVNVSGGSGSGGTSLGTAENLRGGRTSAIPATGPLRKAVDHARSSAAIAHRAEKALAAFTYSAALALSASLSSLLITTPRTADPKWVNSLMLAGMWILIGAGTGLLAMAAVRGTDNTETAAQRPLRLLWDLICFLPRAGHPFGPPCYAERVVPELLGRYQWWITDEGRESPNTSKRRIVISAHSLGAVLAAATILAAPEEHTNHLSFLTYGVQLRAYFSRLFPELLGPAVLGVPPCRPADLTQPDPWHTERRDHDEIEPIHVGSIRALLSGSTTGPGRWLSLWHLTDPLGFPIYQYPAEPDATDDTPYDRYAEEVDRTAYLLSILAHSDYPRTLAYTRALDDLAFGPQPGHVSP
jgi:hypothetical protein